MSVSTSGRRRLASDELSSPRVISGTFWRNTAPARGPLELRPKARAGARYHRRGQAPPLYLSSDRDASWGELFRHTDPAEVSPFEIRRRMSRLHVRELPVLDLTDPTVRDGLDVTEGQLTSNDYRHCRRIADLVWKNPNRFGGILGPSAAKRGEETLAVNQAWLDRVTVEAHRTQTPPSRLVPLFEEIAATLHAPESRETDEALVEELRNDPRAG
jgi:RES domain-containing protein